MVAAPAASAVATPFAFTAATAGLLLLHVTVRPVRALPTASFGIAANTCVAPTLSVAVGGVSSTEATGPSTTVTAAEADLFSEVAVIVTFPGAHAVATPLALTVATTGLLLLHSTVRPGTAFPAASFGVATNGLVAPTVRVSVDGSNATVSTITSPSRGAVRGCEHPNPVANESARMRGA